MARTFRDIVNSMVSYIKGVKPFLDTSEGTITNDVIISAPSQEIAKLYNEMDIVSRSQNIYTAPDSALRGHGGNLGLLKRSSRQSKGYVRFFTFTPLLNDIVIAAGTVISTVPTSNNSSQQFLTTTTTTMYSSLSSTYLNPDTSAYEIEVPVISINPGLDSIVGSRTIISLITPIAGINGCYNLSPTFGGSDEEDIEDFRRRIALKWKGSSLGTVSGLLSDVLVYADDVIDAMVVGHEDIDRMDSGAVDVYIKGTRVGSFQEIFNTFDMTYGDLILEKQPVIETFPTSVISSESGIINTTEYYIEKDTGHYRNSVRGKDMIKWNTPLPSSSGSLTINYSYNSLITDLQTYFEREDKRVQNVDILIKWAIEVPIDVTVLLKTYSGYDESNVILEVQNEVALFFNSLNIGEEVQQADIARVILNVNGVDDLFLPFTLFKSSDGEIVPNVFNNLVLPINSYAVGGNIIVNTV